MGAQLASGHWPSQANQSYLSSAIDSNRNVMQQRHTPSASNSAIMNTQRSGFDNNNMSQKLNVSQFAQQSAINASQFDSQGRGQWNASQPLNHGGAQGGAMANNDVAQSLSSTQERKGVQGGILWASQQNQNQ